jgi:hypothetical protein
MTETELQQYRMKIFIMKTLGYALGLLKGMNAPRDAVEEIEGNIDYIYNEYCL